MIAPLSQHTTFDIEVFRRLCGLKQSKNLSFNQFYENAIASGPQVHPGHKREYNYPPHITRDAEDEA